MGPEVKPTMHRIVPEPVTSARRLARSACTGLVFLSSVAALVCPASAQGPRVVVSTTDDIAVGVPFPVGDSELVAAAGGSEVKPFFMEGHFQGTCGFAPSDIDAFTHRPGSTPGSAGSLAFSLLSNEGGFLDGDILILAPGGGAAVLISELDLATALGAPAANIDVDALTYDDQGRILFSLQLDQDNTSLGLVLDGDILRLEVGFSSVTRTMDESEVQVRVTSATGMTDPILDVQALEWAGGQLWAAVQSPSTHDGAVIQLSGTPQVVVDETAMGLGGAEIDALGDMRVGDEIPSFRMSVVEALPGTSLHVQAHGPPNGVLMVLMAGNTGYRDFSRFPGFGGWYLDRFDPWFSAILSAHAVSFVQLDSSGHFETDWFLPAGTEFGTGIGGEPGWSFQVLEIGAFELSAPLRLRKL